MQPFTKNAIAIIQSIPEGKVMTYGQIAELAGNRRGARQIVRILHAMSQRYDLPWHRVINAKGEIAIRDDEGLFLQKLHLESEGVEVSNLGRIDLPTYQYIANLGGAAIEYSEDPRSRRS